MRTIPKKTKLNFNFHNPNTPEKTADYIIKILIQANQSKVERALKEEASKHMEGVTEEQSRYVG